MKKIAIYALTKKGADLARFVARQIGSVIRETAEAKDVPRVELFFHKRCGNAEQKAVLFENLSSIVAGHFATYDGLVFITACGIAVRVVAPLLSSKVTDPAVVVLDQNGKYCISLVSGHLGGANMLARKIALITGGEPVITTATDTENIISIDVLARQKGMEIENISALKSVTGAMLAGEPVQVFDPEDRLEIHRNFADGVHLIEVEDEDSESRESSESDWCRELPGIRVSWRKKEPYTSELLLHPKCLVAGIGCNRGTDTKEILNLLYQTFDKNELALKSLRAIATIEAKKEEAGLIQAALRLGVELLFFNKNELATVSAPNPSSLVESYMGVGSVCEAAAILATGRGHLIVPKIKSKNATIAVALDF